MSDLHSKTRLWVMRGLFSLVGILTLVHLMGQPLFAQEPADLQGLVPGKGVDLVLENCTVCHSTAIIRQNHMSREAWDRTLTWMKEEQGMWELEEKDRNSILDYLSRAQGVEDQTHVKQDKPRKNPMYKFDYKPNPL